MYCNSPSPCREIGECIDRILAADRTCKSELEVLRGRLIFVESQIFGRVAHAALRIASDAVNGVPFARLDPKLKKALLFLKDRVLHDRPKEMVSTERKVIHIYTDACFETELSGLGGVAYSDDGQCMGFFGESLDVSQVERIKKSGQKTVIAELESLAMLAGVKTWMGGLRDCLVHWHP